MAETGIRPFMKDEENEWVEDEGEYSIRKKNSYSIESFLFTAVEEVY